MNPTLRAATKDDTAFVFSSWLKSYRNGPAVRLMNNEDYFRCQAEIITQVLAKSVTLLACDPEDTSVIWGFVVFDEDDCHYIYVKHLLRGHGIASLLWDAAGHPHNATHMTIAAEKYLQTHPNTVAFNPFSILEYKRER